MTPPFKQYAVFGNPIEHSLSPKIHYYFSQNTGIDLVYEKHCIALNQFEESVDNFFKQGGNGLNITVPFKQKAYQMVDIATDVALATQAVNTLWQENGQLMGANTDGIGLVRDMTQNLLWSLKDKKVLILGAGGAVQGVLPSLIAQQVKNITLLNRTEQTAIDLAKKTSTVNCPIQGGSYSLSKDLSPDVIINATSMGLQGKLPPISAHCLIQQPLCYDMVYSLQEKETPWTGCLKQQGISTTATGIGMLIEQAAEAYYLWHKVRPDTINLAEKL